MELLPTNSNPLNLKEESTDVSVACVASTEATPTNNEKKHIDTDREAIKCFPTSLRTLDHEECWALLLDQSLDLISVVRFDVGEVALCTLDTRELAKRCLISDARGVIIAHNHPSGKALPSKKDVEATNDICQALDLIGTRLVDHLIIGQDAYFSLAARKQKGYD